MLDANITNNQLNTKNAFKLNKGVPFDVFVRTQRDDNSVHFVKLRITGYQHGTYLYQMAYNVLKNQMFASFVRRMVRPLTLANNKSLVRDLPDAAKPLNDGEYIVK